jgi:ammonia channel protein AmtB
MAIDLLIMCLLGGVGMTTIIVEGTIFMPIKAFLKKFVPEKIMKIMDCHQCCGFWSGIFMSLLLYTPNITGNALAIIHDLGINFACACAVSLLSVLWATVMLFIESKTTINQ